MAMEQWTVADIPAQSGRLAVVTGGNSGIGFEAASALAGAGARVVLAVRREERGQVAAAEIAKAHPQALVEVMVLDLADLASVRRFTAAFLERHATLDLLINNAGVMALPYSRTADGFELQLATNYLGPFALTDLLLAHITDRVVSVSSQLHRMGNVHLDDLNTKNRPYKALDAYNDSKLDIILFSLELQGRLDAAGSTVRSIVAHPGIASTNLAGHSGSGKVTNALRFLFNDAPTGALSLLYAATQDIPGNSYVGPRGLGSMKGHPALGEPAAAGRDPEVAKKLWDATVQLIDTSHGPATH